MTFTAASAAVAISIALVPRVAVSAGLAKKTGGAANAAVNSTSCPSAGNCAAVGDFLPPGRNLAFVVGEKAGAWSKAEKIPGIAALPGGDFSAKPTTVSCSSAGDCSAGGSYTQRSRSIQAFVVSERKGVWGKAEEVPGSAALNAGGNAAIDQVSCRSAGNCTAAGTYSVDRPHFLVEEEGFVVSEKNGQWDKATFLPGAAALSHGRGAWPTALSCGAPGDCALGGTYISSRTISLVAPFVATEKNGTWSNAERLPGT